mgnify:CR=1 FL=1
MSGVDHIAAERQRQMEVEGWTPEHDAQHTSGELAMAAALYAAPVDLFEIGKDHRGYDVFYDRWPWKDIVSHPRDEMGPGREVNAWDKRKKHSRLRRLEIAGALIAAEIDRLERLENETPEVKRG